MRLIPLGNLTGLINDLNKQLDKNLTEEGKVETWFEYKESGQRRPAFTCTPEEWDRLVAWVEWQRKDKAINKGEGELCSNGWVDLLILMRKS